jgi:hypothetical protein
MKSWFGSARRENSMRALSLVVAVILPASGAFAADYNACNATNTACRNACYTADKHNKNYDVEGCLSGCASAQSNCVGGFSGPKDSHLKAQESTGSPAGGKKIRQQ